MFCRKCGSEVSKKTKVCPNCGVRPLYGTKHCQACGATTKSEQEFCKECGVRLIKHGPTVKDDTPKVAKAFSFCMPIVGIILFFVWRTKKPESAKSVCNWTILGVAGGMVLYTIGLIWGALSSATGS
ncbi:MAG: zinc ribbon domain-containing protein [Desulfitobacterium sp.]